MRSMLHLIFILLLAVSANSGTIEGMVSDSTSGYPVGGAVISVWVYTADGTTSLLVKKQTDRSGHFLFENLPSGQYYLSCQHPHFFDVRLPDFDLQEGDVRHFLVMLIPKLDPHPPILAGHVYSTPPMLPAFIPIEGAVVYAKGRKLETKTITGYDGLYRFQELPSGVYLVWAEAEGHQPMANPDTIVVPEKIDGVGTIDEAVIQHDIYLIPDDEVPPVSLEGMVWDASVNTTNMPAPLHPAVITLSFRHPLIYAPIDTVHISITNNPDGSFIFKDLLPAVYKVKCEADGYHTEYIEELDLRRGPDRLEFWMRKKSDPTENLISGHVLNTLDRSPIHNATVTLASLGPFDIAYVSYSNEKGVYKFKSILPGKYEIRAVARGFYPSPVDTIEIRDNTYITDHYIFMKPMEYPNLVTLHGHVYNGLFSSLKPVFPAYITLFRYDETGDSLIYHTRNHQDGSYRIPNILPGRYTVRCHASGFQSEVIRDLPLEPPDVKQNFMLIPEVHPSKGWVTGKVHFDRTERPVAGARIHFISENGIYRHAITGNDGGYKAYIPVGQYYVSCVYQKPDSSYYYQEYYDNVHTIADATPVMIYPEEVTSGIDFGIPLPVPPPSVTITGVVTDDLDRPLRYALVRALPINQRHYFRENIDVYQVWTDENGKYKIEIYFHEHTFVNVVHGFIVSAEKPGYKLEFYQEKPAPYLADILWTSEGTVFRDINFTLDPTHLSNSISGTVTSESGNPISHTFIIAANANTGEVFFTFSDRSGGYTLDAIPTGYYYLLFTAPGHLPEYYDDAWLWENATPVLAYGNITGIDAQLTPFLWRLDDGNLAGIITDRNEQPIQGALISLKDDQGEMINYGLSDNKGSYSINGLAQGRYEVQVSKVGYHSASEWIEYDSTNSEFSMLNITLDKSVTSLHELPDFTDQIPNKIELLANYPNPFNPETKIRFGIPDAQSVNLAIYDILGQKIRQLMNTTLPAGRYDVTWDGISDSGYKASSGVYFYILITGNQKFVKKMVLRK